MEKFHYAGGMLSIEVRRGVVRFKTTPGRDCALVAGEPVQFFTQCYHAAHHDQRRAFNLLRQLTQLASARHRPRAA